MAEFVEVITRKQNMCAHYGQHYCIGCPIYVACIPKCCRCDAFCNTFPEEAEQLIMSWEPSVDWSEVPVDTKILVRNNPNMPWIKRYFAGYRNGAVYTFYDGQTSWSTTTHGIRGWAYAKLAEEDKNE